MKVGRISVDLSAGTAQFIADMDRANSKLRDFGAAAGNAGSGGARAFRQIGDGSAHAVTGVQATSAALRVLEGNMQNNLRAAERFLANTLNLGNVLQSAFPVVGAIALGGVLSELVTKASEAYEAFKRLQDAPNRIAREFNTLSQSVRIGNEELQVTNDRLANEIAKLEGRPQNGLKLALDEARLAADKLAESLTRDISNLQKLLEQEQVGAFKAIFTGQTPTTGITEANKQLLTELTRIDIEEGRQTRATTDPRRQAEIAEQATQQRRARIQQEIKAAEASLRTAQAAQKQASAGSGQIVSVIGGVPIPSAGRGAQPGRTTEIETIERRLDVLYQLAQRFPETAQNQQLTQQKSTLDAAAAADALTRPYRDKMHELDAELQGVQANLAAIGQSQSAQTLAKSWAAAQLAIAHLNDELAKHHQALTLEQQVSIVAAYDQIAAAKAEEEWRTKFEQSTTAIRDRIASLNLLTTAIGQGYDAQRRANVETQVMSTLGQRYNDPEWMRTHQPDVAALRSQFGREFDAQNKNRLAATTDALQDQIDLNKQLADAELNGAAAVRQATLEARIAKVEKDNLAGSTKALTDAMRNEAAAAEHLRAVQAATDLQLQIDATNRLTAAQLGGTEAVRQAQLQNRIAEIRRDVADPSDQAEQIRRATALSEAQRQQQIVTDALKTGMAYQNQLESINEQIAALEQLKATHGDTLAIEISLHELEKERAKVWSDQVQVLGSARDGLKAYFAEMATEGVSAAAQVHDALKAAFDGLNDGLSKLVSGQKVNWSSLFQSISADLMKMNLRNIEAQIAQRWFPQRQTGPGAGAPGASHRRPWDEKYGIGPVPSDGTHGIGVRDGQSPGTALFVTTTDVSASGNSALSTSATAATASSHREFSQVLSGIGGFFRRFAGFRGDGGPADADMMHLVGEDGPELFVPRSDGAILPNDQLGSSIPAPPDIGTASTTDPLAGLWSKTPLPKAPFSAKYALGSMGPMFASMGVSVGLMLLSKLSNQPKDHHFKPGAPFSLPSYNYRASGGAVDFGQAYMVGEQGPEVWTPPASGGSIVPNHALGQHLNGTTYYVDARGSDPAAVEQRIRQANIATGQAATRTSFKSFQEYQQRTPQRK